MSVRTFNVFIMEEEVIHHHHEIHDDGLFILDLSGVNGHNQQEEREERRGEKGVRIWNCEEVIGELERRKEEGRIEKRRGTRRNKTQ